MALYVVELRRRAAGLVARPQRRARAARAAARSLAAWRRVARGAATVALAGGPAGDLFDDLPPLRVLRAHPLRLWAARDAGCAAAR